MYDIGRLESNRIDWYIEFTPVFLPTLVGTQHQRENCVRYSHDVRYYSRRSTLVKLDRPFVPTI